MFLGGFEAANHATAFVYLCRLFACPSHEGTDESSFRVAMEVLTALYAMNGMMMVGMMVGMRCGIGDMMMDGGTMVSGMMNGMNMNSLMKPLLLRMRKLLCPLTKQSTSKKLLKLSEQVAEQLAAEAKRTWRKPRKPPSNWNAIDAFVMPTLSTMVVD